LSVQGRTAGSIARHFLPGNAAQGQDLPRHRRDLILSQVPCRGHLGRDPVADKRPQAILIARMLQRWGMQARSASAASFQAVTSGAMLLKQLLADNGVGLCTSSLTPDCRAVPG
jgi:hypothetical protein